MWIIWRFLWEAQWKTDKKEQKGTGRAGQSTQASPTGTSSPCQSAREIIQGQWSRSEECGSSTEVLARDKATLTLSAPHCTLMKDTGKRGHRSKSSILENAFFLCNAIVGLCCLVVAQYGHLWCVPTLINNSWIRSTVIVIYFSFCYSLRCWDRPGAWCRQRILCHWAAITTLRCLHTHTHFHTRSPTQPPEAGRSPSQQGEPRNPVMVNETEAEPGKGLLGQRLLCWWKGQTDGHSSLLSSIGSPRLEIQQLQWRPRRDQQKEKMKEWHKEVVEMDGREAWTLLWIFGAQVGDFCLQTSHGRKTASYLFKALVFGYLQLTVASSV